MVSENMENACALQSREKCYFLNNVLQTFWYQFCNFQHFLKAENSKDSLASLCDEFCILFHVTQYETGLLLEITETVL